MNRVLSLLLIGVLLGVPDVAQGQPDTNFGLTLGANLGTLEAPAAETGLRTMVAAGLVAEVKVTGPLSLQPQLLLSQKGALVEGEGGGGIRYGAGYIELPVLLRAQGPSIGPVTPYLLAGGFGGLKVFERQRAGGDLALELRGNDTSFFRRTDAGWTAGIGGVVPVSEERRLRLAVRYAHGLVDVARDLDDQPYADTAPFPAEAKTRTVSLAVRIGM